jgi:hypothetical protein
MEWYGLINFIVGEHVSAVGRELTDAYRTRAGEFQKQKKKKTEIKNWEVRESQYMMDGFL